MPQMQVYRLACRVSRVGDDGAGLWDYIGSVVFDLVYISLPKNWRKFTTWEG